MDSLFDKIIGWLRAGYPQGVPQQDYVALFGILHRSLTPEEVETIAARVARRAEAGDGVVEREHVHEEIRRIAQQTPSDEDLRRVASHLAAGGWPLAAPLGA